MRCEATLTFGPQTIPDTVSDAISDATCQKSVCCGISTGGALLTAACWPRVDAGYCPVESWMSAPCWLELMKAANSAASLGCLEDVVTTTADPPW